MKRMMLIAALAAMIAGPVSAAGGYLSVGLGANTGFKAYDVQNNEAMEIPAADLFNIGGDLDLSIGYRAADWFAVGFSTGVTYNHAGYNDMNVFAVPFMAEIIFEPSMGGVRLPVELAAGGHVQFSGDDIDIGPAFGVSAGVAVDVSESFTVGYAVKFSLLMQLPQKDRMTFQIDMVPIAIDMTYRF